MSTSPILTALSIFVLVIVGVLITYWPFLSLPLLIRLAVATPIVFAANGLIGLLLGSWIGLSTTTAVLSLLLTVCLSGLIGWQFRGQLLLDVKTFRDRINSPQLSDIALIITHFLIFLLIFTILRHGYYQNQDGIWTAMVDNYADLTLHLGIINRFILGQNFPPEHPVLAGASLAYPFLVDLQAGILSLIGITLEQAFLLQGILLMLAIFALLHWLTFCFSGSHLAGCLAVVLLLFNGGFGWWMFITEASQAEGGWMSYLMHLPHDFTAHQELYRWGNSLLYWFIPMRSMLFGAALSLVVWIIWWEVLTEEQNPSVRKQMIFAALVAGLMPLAHAHSFACLMVQAGVLSLLNRKNFRYWVEFAVIATTLALPQILWITSGAQTDATKFIAWHFGWTKGENNFLWYWFLNTGLFIPLLIAALVWLFRQGVGRRKVLIFWLPFAFWFLLPNIIKVAPWEWDNIKLLYLWYLGSVSLVGMLLARLFRGGIATACWAILLVLLLTASSALDYWRVLSGAVQFQVYSKADQEIAKFISENTTNQALILSAPIHNSQVLLTGRRLFMGYPGTLWTHGLQYEARLQEVKDIYNGAPQALEQLKKNNIQYIILTTKERVWAKDQQLEINNAFLDQFSKKEFKSFGSDEVQLLYDLRQLYQ
jgi:hypothetical protein